jgi:hypothetical protein
MRANGNTKSLRNVPFRPRLYSKNADSTVLHPALNHRGYCAMES